MTATSIHCTCSISSLHITIYTLAPPPIFRQVTGIFQGMHQTFETMWALDMAPLPHQLQTLRSVGDSLQAAELQGGGGGRENLSPRRPWPRLKAKLQKDQTDKTRFLGKDGKLQSYRKLHTSVDICKVRAI